MVLLYINIYIYIYKSFLKKYESFNLTAQFEGNDVDCWFIMQTLFLRCCTTKIFLFAYQMTWHFNMTKDNTILILFGLCLLDVFWLNATLHFDQSYLFMHFIKYRELYKNYIGIFFNAFMNTALRGIFCVLPLYVSCLLCGCLIIFFAWGKRNQLFYLPVLAHKVS